MKKRSAERIIDFCTFIAVFCLLIFVLMTATSGCSKRSDREYVYDSDQCLTAGKRAVMLCPKYVDRCIIECRDRLPAE